MLLNALAWVISFVLTVYGYVHGDLMTMWFGGIMLIVFTINGD